MVKDATVLTLELEVYTTHHPTVKSLGQTGCQKIIHKFKRKTVVNKSAPCHFEPAKANQKSVVRGTWGLSVDLQEIPQGTGSGFLWDQERDLLQLPVL